MKPLERITLAGCFLSLALATGCSQEPPPQFADASLLLVSIDTLRADHLGCYGYERATSPHLDALAAECILFENCVAQATWTTPAHAALMTSRYPRELGLRRWPDPGKISPDFPTLAEVLSAAGLRCFGFTESAWIRGNLGFSRGFEEYDDGGGLLRQILPRLQRRLPSFQDQRFFVFLHTYDVHWYDPPAIHLEPFSSQYAGSLEPSDALRRRVQGGKNQDWLADLSETDRHHLVDLYDASIRYVDETLSMVFRHLRKLGLLDRAVLVITSDHGEEFFEHGRTGHGYSVYEEQTRVPLLLRLPQGLYGGQRVREVVRLIDVMPTLLDLLAIGEGIPSMQGETLLHHFFSSSQGDRLAFTDRGHAPTISVRDGHLKVILDLETKSAQVFDLGADPAEKNALSGRTQSGLVDTLKDWYGNLQAPENSLPMEPLSDQEADSLRKLGYLDEGE